MCSEWEPTKVMACGWEGVSVNGTQNITYDSHNCIKLSQVRRCAWVFVDALPLSVHHVLHC